MIDFSGIELPFDVGSLVSSGNGLLGLVGPFVLAGLAVIFAPMLIDLLKGVFHEYKGASAGDRFLRSQGDRGWTKREKVGLAVSNYRDKKRMEKKWGSDYE